MSAIGRRLENADKRGGVILAPNTEPLKGSGGGRNMCVICERELWGEHRAVEHEFFKPCRQCKKFPGLSSDGT